ncbi:MAG TPA: Asd/ArgC dimerization domain-containing protein [Candidatus Baltobacteraceae bacterium]|jgi:aspartate-semialdehyde dehydrogenase|nr:Asd/ArgC dimerization domain-containing protein [Candidatus Baltobacteraceae bacterium]
MKVAVVGATGVVGETIVRVLDERGIPLDDLGLFASRTRDHVRATTPEALAEYEAVFFASSEDASERYAPSLLERGAIVIDNSSTYRMQTGVPLIVPEVNPHAVRPEHRLFPVGNCTAIILCVALAPVRNVAGLSGVRVATYQSISGAGRAALEEFDRGEGNVVRNVVPQIGSFDEFGYSGEENKVREETRKVLELPDLPVFATTVRVPVRTAHSEAVFFETSRETSVEELAQAFESAPGLVYHRDGIVTPREVEGTDLVHVARLRACDKRTSFQMWVVGDQLRKGAATNGVQILELVMSLRA